MKAFWERLSEREKLFVGVGGAIVLLLAVMQLVVAPAVAWRARMTDKRASAEQLYEIVAQASATAGGAMAAAGVDLSTPILNVLTDTTGRYGVVVNYRNGRPDGGVEANVVADPAKLFEWLTALEASYGITVATADIARGADTGAQAQLTLVRRVAS
jgi:type II secretory pathway component PulM